MQSSVAIRELRVTADTSNYEAGMRRVEATEASLLQRMRQVDVAFDSFDGRLSSAGNSLAGLSRRYLDGYRDTETFTRGLRSLNTMLETGRVEATRAEAIYAGMSSKLGMVANAADLSARGYGQIGTVIGRVNAQLAEQAALADKAAASLSRTGGARAGGFAQHEVTNLSRQMADVGVMLAMGQSPFMTLVTQGPQIADIMGDRGIKGALTGVVAGLGSLVNPTTIAMAGFTALGYAGAAAFDGINAARGGGSFNTVGNYRSGVDTRLTDILQEAAERSGLKVDAFSGFRAGDPRFHGKGLATDIRLFDAAGAAIPNYQNAAGFRSYEQFAQMARTVQMEQYPELAGSFRWGGYFGGGKGRYGAMDTMHFDLGGAGMAGGSWQGGLNAGQRALWPGAESVGMGQLADQVTTTTRAVTDLATGSTSAATATMEASRNLATFGGGLGQIGSQLGSALGGILGGRGGDAMASAGATIGNLSGWFGGGAAADPWAGMRTVGGGGGGGLGGFGNILGSVLSFVPKLFGLAEGGHVRGPGTSTSDSIPAWLSDGEYVVNARSTARYRGLLDMINGGSDVLALASGGLARSARSNPFGVPSPEMGAEMVFKFERKAA